MSPECKRQTLMTPIRCAACKDKPETLSPANDMYIGPPFPVFNCVSAINSTLVAICRLIARVWTLRTGKTAYVGPAVNLRHKSHRPRSKLPAPPSDLPILLIRRKTRAQLEKERRRAPFVANRWRVEASFLRLLTSRRENNGSVGTHYLVEKTATPTTLDTITTGDSSFLPTRATPLRKKTSSYAGRFSFYGEIIRHSRMHRRSHPGLKSGRPTIAATCGAWCVAKYPKLQGRQDHWRMPARRRRSRMFGSTGYSRSATMMRPPYLQTTQEVAFCYLS